MATILLSAAGASIGAGFGGTVLGLSGAVIGRAVGATVGRVIDQRLLGNGSQAVETGRIDRLRLQTAGEGTMVPRLWGQMRLPGHAIWAAPLKELVKEQGGGAGKGSGPRVKQYSYSLSAAFAICEGTILGVGRVWADGEEISPSSLNMRVYCGTEDQLPDPCIAAYEGENATAYRGIAYVVVEDLSLEPWGNRLPQLTFEVSRQVENGNGLDRLVTAVALIPGTGEYSLATTPVNVDLDLGENKVVNHHTPLAATDFMASLGTLDRELPNVGSVSLIVSWFGDDLRVGKCSIKPKVERQSADGDGMAWRAGGVSRKNAEAVAEVDGRPIYGGTPADASVVEALRSLTLSGKKAIFYPFILMEQISGNGKVDPWSGNLDQPVMPWRGRITSEIAAGMPGSPDGSEAARVAVKAFFGNAMPTDFTIYDDKVSYSGPAEWSYRRFILHYAHLCAAAGGVDSFLIGSEMVGLTRIMGDGRGFPAVDELRRLAADVRTILGSAIKIGYASDWSEYFGYHKPNGDVFFHLDDLWSDSNIDFIGIDNYMPLSDWRDGDHLDQKWRRVDNVDHLKENICGGEGFHWYYADDADRNDQNRTKIYDGAYGEDWVWRYKDLRGWWSNYHYNRVSGVRSEAATSWIPGGKPIWFTEMGCAALDRATNQPNKFLDAMSSESSLPYFSHGRRDDFIQYAYIRAMTEYWSTPDNNPEGSWGGRMVDVSRAHVWCWDARPFPVFPGRTDVWADGPAWERGHWLNGRAGAVPLADVVADICESAGIVQYDVSGLAGLVRGYSVTGGETDRASIQALMVAHGFDVVERDGKLIFRSRDVWAAERLTFSELAIAEELERPEIVRMSDPEIAGRVRLSHVDATGDYNICTAETTLPGDDHANASDNEFPMSMTRQEGQAAVERWLAESRVARDSIRFALPPSRSDLGPGDIVWFDEPNHTEQRWRIDRVERDGAAIVEAVRVEPGVYVPSDATESNVIIRKFSAPSPVWPVIMDLPLIRGDEDPYSPYLAVTGTPWPGAVDVWHTRDEMGGYEYDLQHARRSFIGRTQNALKAARCGVVDRSSTLRIHVKGGALSTATTGALFGGANLMAIGDGTAQNWELFQFRKASPLDGESWEVSELLRGQLGTDAVMPQEWPAGSIVVALNGSARQLPTTPNELGFERIWRVGPSFASAEDSSYRNIRATPKGIGLRPLSPCHLRRNGKILSWTRRTRSMGDRWDSADVPLGEVREEYVVQIMTGGALVIEARTSSTTWVIPDAVWASLTPAEATVRVAQISEIYGPGPFAWSKLNV